MHGIGWIHRSYVTPLTITFGSHSINRFLFAFLHKVGHGITILKPSKLHYTTSGVWLTCPFGRTQPIINKENKQLWNHNITKLMSCVHGPNNRFKNQDSGCRNPTASNHIWSQVIWTLLISWVIMLQTTCVPPQLRPLKNIAPNCKPFFVFLLNRSILFFPVSCFRRSNLTLSTRVTWRDAIPPLGATEHRTGLSLKFELLLSQGRWGRIVLPLLLYHPKQETYDDVAWHVYVHLAPSGSGVSWLNP